MAPGNPPFNLLLLEENEVYLIDCGMIQVSMVLIHEGIRLSVDGFSGVARLCSKSIFLQPLEPEVDLVKLLFDKIITCEIITVEQDLHFQLRITTEALTRVAVGIARGELRAVSPYTCVKAPQQHGKWLVEITFLTTQRFSTASFFSGVSGNTSCAEPTSGALPVSEDTYQAALNGLEQILAQPLELQTPSALVFARIAYWLILVYIHEKARAHDRVYVPDTNRYVAPGTLHSAATGQSRYPDIIKAIARGVPAPDAFPIAAIGNHREQFLLDPIQAELQLPLHTARCTVLLTDSALYYRQHPRPSAAPPFERHAWDALQCSIPRYVNLRRTAVSLCFAWTKSGNQAGTFGLSLDQYRWQEVVLLFSSEPILARILTIVRKCCPRALQAVEDPHYLQHFTDLWRRWKINTFHYLAMLNALGNRSEKDFSQYPVMPWTLVQFHSDTVDLTDPAAFRDLSIPVGAVNQHQFRSLQMRMNESCSVCIPRALPEATTVTASASQSSSPSSIKLLRFLYGAHYSTPGYVVYWLSREFPECQLRLQGGRLDAWPRLFHSISSTWERIREAQNPANSAVELIPQFYAPTASAFLENRLGLNLSRPNLRSNGPSEDGRPTHVDPKTGVLSDVEVPPWAHGSTTTFLKVLREALESPLVSCTIHKWIDLIFGYQQRGQKAEEALNLFHPITYLTSIMARDGKEAADRAIAEVLEAAHQSQEALLTQVREFGQAPVQLFTEPHPSRIPLELLSKPDNNTSENFEINHSPCPAAQENLEALIAFPRSSAPWYVLLAHNPSLVPPLPPHLRAVTPLAPEGRRRPAPVTAPMVTRGIASEGSVTTRARHALDDDQQPPRFKRSTLLTMLPPLSKSTRPPLDYNRPKALCADQMHLNTGQAPGAIVCVGCNDGQLRLLKSSKPKSQPYGTLPVSADPITAVALTEGGHHFAVTGDRQGHVQLIGDLEKLSLEQNRSVYQRYPFLAPATKSPHTDAITCLSVDYFRDGTRKESNSNTHSAQLSVCSASADYTVAFWDCSDGGPSASRAGVHLLSQVDLDAAALDHSQNILLVGTMSGEIRLYDFRCHINSGPIWIGNLWSHDGHTKLRAYDCSVAALSSYGTFSAVAQPARTTLLCVPSHFSEQRTAREAARHITLKAPVPQTPIKGCCEVFLWDIRMLQHAPQPPLPADAKDALVARFAWPEEAVVHVARCDGRRWAIACASVSQKNVESSVPKGTSTVLRTSRDSTSDALYRETDTSDEDMLRSRPTRYFCASVADLAGGFKSREVCRWPLQLTTTPYIIAPPRIWPFGGSHDMNTALDSSHNVSGPTVRQLWFIDAEGQVEIIH